MRLWTVHPKYLDARGLVTLWREALLAQAVLRRRGRGYARHPQLIRFRRCPRPTCAVAEYLRGVHAESERRGCRFAASTSTRATLTFQPDLTQRREEFRRRGLRATLEALHVRLDQRAAGVEVERDPDGVVENDLLGLLVALH